MQVVNLTTPAQLFHCLRRQVLRPWRKPLVVMAPKSLLRHPLATSSLEELATGRFQRVIPDTAIEAAGSLRKVVLCSGKIYYDLLAARGEARDVALVRLEQLYPFAPQYLLEALDGAPKGTPLVWVQEEPWNMGARSFLRDRWGEELESRFQISYISREASASPATGSAAAHKKEQEELVTQALA
jgi:2-oxoglutarate dehydrogenase E1 component